MKKIIVLIVCTFLYRMHAHNPEFVILIPSYNNAQWYQYNLDSVYAQDYPHYRVIYIDDVSTDNTAQKVEAYISDNQYHNSTLIKNTDRQYKMANMYKAIHTLCLDHEIVVILDGDDCFSTSTALSTIAQHYTKGAWVTYGTYCEIRDINLLWPTELTPDILKTLPQESRLFPAYSNRKEVFGAFLPGHPFTFYSWLFKQIPIEDLLLDGEFVSAGSDIMFCYPIVEMAGNKCHLISEVLYSHNKLTPISDSIIAHHVQDAIRTQVVNKQPYKALSREYIC